VPPAVACDVIGIGLTKIYKLLDQGELQSFTVGRRRLITINSINEFIERRLAASAKPRFTNPTTT
jgi:excisionase family DNA binding protein